MDLKSKHKIEAAFSMSSMTDVIFLLLIFFLLTSSFVPSGLTVNLPSSKASSKTLEQVRVTVTEDLNYYVNGKLTSEKRIEDDLRQVFEGSEGVVVLNIDKSVPTEHLVRIAGIAKSMNVKVSIATKPE
jgi:biopolymer transport protein ExbD